MRTELSNESQAKAEDILQRLCTCYDLEDLTTQELLDALLDLGVDLLLPEVPPVSNPRDRLVAYCGEKVATRG